MELKCDANEFTYEAETDSQSVDLWLPRRGSGRGLDWEFEISGYKLLYREWIDNQALLYSIQNSLQYPVINNSIKEYEKECTCVYR